MLEFNIPAMSCGHCVGVVTAAIRRLDPRAVVDADLATRQLRVDSTADREALAAALREADYPPA